MPSFLANLPFADHPTWQLLIAAFAAALAVSLLFLLYRALFGHRLRIPGGSRARQARLGLVDAFSLDGQRQLVLVRRDNVEHLVMIGGPNDVLIEAQIIRAQSTGIAREKDNSSAPAAKIQVPPAPAAPTPAPPNVRPAPMPTPPRPAVAAVAKPIASLATPRPADPPPSRPPASETPYVRPAAVAPAVAPLPSRLPPTPAAPLAKPNLPAPIISPFARAPAVKPAHAPIKPEENPAPVVEVAPPTENEPELELSAPNPAPAEIAIKAAAGKASSEQIESLEVEMARLLGRD